MRYLVLGLVFACSHPRPIAPAAEHELLERSHRWFEAFDRMDGEGTIGPLSETFSGLSEAGFIDLALTKKLLADRVARHAPLRSRTWSDERVFAGENGAVFVGLAVETHPAEGGERAFETTGFHTLVWTREHGEWRIQFWEWVRSPAPQLADLGWLAGTWHSPALDAHWENVAGALYGVALNDGGFEVNVVDDNDDDGKPQPIELDAIDQGRVETKLPLVAANPRRLEFASGSKRVIVTKTAAGWRGAFVDPPQPEVAFDMLPGTLAPAPELADEDRAFDRDTARDGADGWTRHFAADGALWRRTGRIEGHDQIAAAIGKTLAAGALRWQPVANGKRGDVGFTLGTWTFAKSNVVVARGSYCTIWKRDGDRWKVLFDIGRTAAL